MKKMLVLIALAFSFGAFAAEPAKTAPKAPAKAEKKVEPKKEAKPKAPPSDKKPTPKKKVEAK